jgi:subtilisin family serine protease
MTKYPKVVIRRSSWRADRTVMTFRALAAVAVALGASAAPAAGAQPVGQWPLAGGSSLRAPLAWKQSTGTGVVVAVLDTGAQLDRRELRGRVWTNPGEIAGNGRDDDGDGIVDDVHGADFVNGDGVPADDNGHGTHVAGIIAAHGLVRGLAPGATILPVKVLGADKSGNAHLLAQGIAYAVARGARILNVSVNGNGVSTELESAIRDAQAAGAVIVASAGNDGRDLAAQPSYPISYGEDAVLGVGATDAAGNRAHFSNYGPGVDVTAPGADIVSLGFPGIAFRSGTSMAAAYVSATLALEAAAAPGLATADLRDALLRATGPDNALDAAGAVQAVAGRAGSISIAAPAVKPKAKRRHRRHRRHHASHHARRARR